MAGWYDWLEKTVAPTDDAVKLLLVAVIVVSVFMLLQPSKSIRAGWLVYLISP